MTCKRKVSAIEMASKLWIYGKKITLWGALVSSLPFMFIPMLALSAFGIAISVPLGCAVGAYVCFRKVFSGLARKRLIACKRENSELKKNEAGFAGLGMCLEGSDVNECEKRKSELVGHSQVQYEELRSEAGDDLDINVHRGESPIYEEGYEDKIHEVERLEEEPHRLKSYEEPHHHVKLCESETPLKWDSHDLPSVGGQTPAGETHSMQSDEVKVHGEVGQVTWDPVERRIPEDGTHSKLRDEGKDYEGEPQLTLNPQAILIEKTATIEQTPKDEIHFSQDEEMKASEGGTQLAWNSDAWIAVEESSLEDDFQSKLSDEMRVSHGEPRLTVNPQTIQMENTAAEEQSPKDETRYNMKEEARASDCETRLTSDNYHALSVEKISPTDTKLRRSEEEKEEEESNEMQESPTNESRPEQSAGLDLEKLSPTDTKHKKGDLEEEEKEKESSEKQEIPSKMLNLEHGGQLDSEKLPHRDNKHRRREEDEDKLEREGRLPVLGNNAKQFELRCANSGYGRALDPSQIIGALAMRNFLLCKKNESKLQEEEKKGTSSSPPPHQKTNLWKNCLNTMSSRFGISCM